jgi:hypothetical protein
VIHGQSVPGKGKSVFVLSPVADGQVLLSDHVVLLPVETVDAAGPPLSDYPLGWTQEHHALVLGPISLVNHSTSPNARVERNFEALMIRLVATRDIAAGEEITYDYGVPLWFEARPPSQLRGE